MGVTLRKKSRSWDREKENQPKHNFKTHFGIIWGNVIKIVFKCRSIYNYDVKGIIWHVFAI